MNSASASPNGHKATVTALTIAQQNAIDLLAGGKNDTETAAALGLHRVTVTRWRLYSPEFRAALAVRRANVWGAAADRLRALLPKALDALADALEDAEQRVPVALALLKFAGPLPVRPADPTDPDDYVVEELAREAARRPSDAERFRARVSGLPDHEEQFGRTRARLAALAAEPPPVPQLPPPA